MDRSCITTAGVGPRPTPRDSTRVARRNLRAAIADVERAGFRQIPLGAAELATLASNAVRVEGGLLPTECRSLFDQWPESIDLDSSPD